MQLQNQSGEALALPEARQQELVKCNRQNPRQCNLERLVVEDRDTEQRQAEQNEINRDAEEVDRLCRVDASRGHCGSGGCEQDTEGAPPGGAKLGLRGGFGGGWG